MLIAALTSQFDPARRHCLSGPRGQILVPALARARPAGILRFDGYEYLPDEVDEWAIFDGFYRDQRGDGELYGVTPSIQSDVVTGPYLKLFIPYSPQRHNKLFAGLCAEIEPLNEGGVQFSLSRDSVPGSTMRALFDCWAGIQPVTLNGQAIRPEWLLYTEPGTGIRGKLAYIPVRAAPEGRNVIEVGRLPRRDAIREQRPPYVIRFWK